MKIQYEIKPMHEQPVKIGDKVRVKEEWYSQLNICGFDSAYARKQFENKNLIIKAAKLVDDYGAKQPNFGFKLDIAYGNGIPDDVLGAMVYKSGYGNFWLPVDSLEKNQPIIKPKQVGKTYKTNLNIKVSRKQYSNFVKDIEKLKIKYANKV